MKLDTSTAETQTPNGNKAFLLTCYMSGSIHGKNLGTPGYSYDFVAQLFGKILAERGKVNFVANPEFNLEQAAVDARNEGLDPVHISFLPFQDVVFCKSAPNVIVPAWEFPDVPDHEFDGNPRNNWIGMANVSDMVVVGGPFTVESMRRGGANGAIEIVPVPTPDGYFRLPGWKYNQQVNVPCKAYWPKQSGNTSDNEVVTRSACLKHSRKSLSQAFKHFNMSLLGPTLYQSISDSLKKRRIEKRKKRASRSSGPDVMSFNYPSTSTLQLSGVVYSSIFNPDDGRKNWQDLLNAFLAALGDKPDATLIMKLITRRKEAVESVVQYYLDRDVPHVCKVGFVVDYLSDETLLKLCEGSTYYYQTTRAEGNCLPLMNYLSAGRPGISPNHSAMGDYFDSQIGWVIDSNPEPCAWPHDSKLRMRTSWGRLVWTSCREQLRDSYKKATSDSSQYEAIGARSAERMRKWASVEAVSARLDAALTKLDELRTKTASDEPVIYKIFDRESNASRKYKLAS
jgi:glycosyltransferase involved in cell wall biosynthesis